MLRRTLIAAAALTLLAVPALAERFDARQFTVDGLIGDVAVTVDPLARGITVDVTGPADRVARVTVRQVGEAVRVEQERERNKSMTINRDNLVTVAVTLPPRTPVSLSGVIGSATLGDLDGPLAVNGDAALELTAGRVTHADISVSGAGDITLGAVTEDLSLSISGAGDVTVGPVEGSTAITISGIGDATVERVNGPVRVSTSGVGEVEIKGGRTPMLEVAISGMGGVSFDGTADARRVSNSGFASVRLNGEKVQTR